MSTQVEPLRYLGLLHPVQVVEVDEKVAQGEVHTSHTLLNVFPYFPEGQVAD